MQSSGQSQPGTPLAQLETPLAQLEVHLAQPGTHLLTYYEHGTWQESDLNIGIIYQVAWSPDGTRIASYGNDGGFGEKGSTLQIWDASTGEQFFCYRNENLSGVTWSPDGLQIAIDSYYGTQIRDLNGKELTFSPHKYSGWFPDGRGLIKGHIEYDNLSKERRSRLSYLRPHWSPDNRRLAIVDNKQVEIWNLRGNRSVRYQGHGEIGDLSWSPDGTEIATAETSEGNETEICVWESATGKLKLMYTGHGPCPRGLLAVAWSPDGKRIASGGDGLSQDKHLHLWDAQTGVYLYAYRGHEPGTPVNTISWSPDGTRIVSGGTNAQVWYANAE